MQYYPPCGCRGRIWGAKKASKVTVTGKWLVWFKVGISTHSTRLVVGSCYKWGALTAKARQMRMAFLLQFRNQGMF